MLNIGGVLGTATRSMPTLVRPSTARCSAWCSTFLIWASALAWLHVLAKNRYRNTLLEYSRRAGRGAGRAPAWKPARRRRPAPLSAACVPTRSACCRLQGHRRIAPARHSRHGRCRRAQHADLHRFRRHDDHARQWSGSDAHDAHRTVCARKPDVIVFELGDGMLGTYGVDAILQDDQVRAALTGVVLCANDPVAAWGGVEILARRLTIIEPAVCHRARPPTTRWASIIQESSTRCRWSSTPLTDAVALGDAVLPSSLERDKMSDTQTFRSSFLAAPVTWPANCCACCRPPEPGAGGQCRSRRARRANWIKSFPHLGRRLATRLSAPPRRARANIARGWRFFGSAARRSAAAIAACSRRRKPGRSRIRGRCLRRFSLAGPGAIRANLWPGARRTATA